jgi:hypothetical protein
MLVSKKYILLIYPPLRTHYFFPSLGLWLILILFFISKISMTVVFQKKKYIKRSANFFPDYDRRLFLSKKYITLALLYLDGMLISFKKIHHTGSIVFGNNEDEYSPLISSPCSSPFFPPKIFTFLAVRPTRSSRHRGLHL